MFKVFISKKQKCNKNKEERYSRVPRLSDQREMEICKPQSEIKMRHLPAVDRFNRYGR